LGIIKKNNPGLLQRYLETLKEIGILRKIKVFNKKKFYYEHISPLIDLLVKKTNLIFQKIENPEIDISLFKFNKLKLIAEVKWKNEIKSKEINKLIEKFEGFKCYKYLILKDKDCLKEKYRDLLEESNIKVLDINDFLYKKLF